MNTTTAPAPTTLAVLLVQAMLTPRALRMLSISQRHRIGQDAAAALVAATDERTRLVAMRVIAEIEGFPGQPGERMSFHRGNQCPVSRSMRGERTSPATRAEIATWSTAA